MPARFDTLSYAQELEAAGVPKAQAEVHAKALAQVVNTMMVTPADLDAAIGALKRELLDKIALVEVEIKAYVDTTVNTAVNRLELKIINLQAEVRFSKWMNGLTLALVVGLYVNSWLA